MLFPALLPGLLFPALLPGLLVPAILADLLVSAFLAGCLFPDFLAGPLFVAFLACLLFPALHASFGHHRSVTTPRPSLLLDCAVIRSRNAANPQRVDTECTARRSPDAMEAAAQGRTAAVPDFFSAGAR